MKTNKSSLKSLTEKQISDIILTIPKCYTRTQLERQCAINWMIFENEKMYRKILGSQIAFLNELYKNFRSGLSPISAKIFLETELKCRKVKINVPFDDWIWFLQTQGLIKNIDDGFTITPKGGAFLKYIQDNEYDLKTDML